MGSGKTKSFLRRNADWKTPTIFSISDIPPTVFRMMTFEDLESWQKARQTVRKIYDLTSAERLCRDFGLCSQLQRAAVSTMSNIAEGFERHHLLEKLQAYNIARGSCGEIRSLLYVIEDNFPQSAAVARTLRKEIVSLGKLVSGLIRSTENRKIK
jgi:four helix bundle protein